MEENKIILKVSPVMRSSAQPWMREFTVSIQNSIDNAITYNITNSEENQGYKETEELEQILVTIREKIRTCAFNLVDELEIEE